MAGSALVATLFLVVNLGATVAVSVRIASRLADDRLDRALVATLLGIAQAVGVPLALAELGILARVPVTVVHLIALIAVYRIVPSRAPAPAGRTSLAGRLAAALGSGLLVAAAAPALRALQSAHGETRHYHVANLATWLRTKTLWTLPFQNPGLPTATHPGNAEMLGLWLVLPSHGDQVASLMILPFALLAVLASASIARDLGGEAGWGALCATALLAAPHVFRTHAYTLASDLPAAAGLAAAVALLLRARAERRASWLVLAGIALGLGLGSKYTVLFPAGVVLIWSVLTLRPRSRVWLLLPGLLLFAAPWFARNWIETGNPLFPQEIHIGDTIIAKGGETPLLALSTTMAEHALHGRTDVLRRWTRLTAQVWGPVTLLAIAGVIAAGVRHPQRRPRLAVAGLALVCAAIYAILPLSGGGPRGLAFLIGSNLRYALPALLLGVAVAAATVPALLRGVLTAAAVGYGAFKIVEGAPLRPDLDLRPWTALLAIAAAGAAYAFAAGSQRVRATRTIALALIPATVLAAWGVVWHGTRDMRPTALEVAVERVADGDPVIVLGPNDLRSILGARLDTELVTLTDGGAARERPYRDPARLSEALDRSPWNVLVVSTAEGVAAVPPGWVPPPTWQRSATVGRNDVYVRVARRT